MPLHADDLLAGPRGRRLCLEFVTSDRSTGTDAGAALWQALIFAAHELSRGTSIMFGPDADRPDQWPEHSPEAIARLLDAVELPRVDDARLLAALTMSVDMAMYWQSPDGTDVIGAIPVVREALRRVAEHLAAAPETAWWSTGIDLADQYLHDFESPFDHEHPVPAYPGAEATLAAWRLAVVDDEARSRDDRPVDPARAASGEWWSAPVSSLRTTTRRLGDRGPLGLTLVEDGFDPERATVSRATPTRPPRVFEIEGPGSWAELCRRFPLDVSNAKRSDWFNVTGRDGAWVQPDFAAVARDYDAVHLTVLAYLTTATREVVVDDERSSVLAGWNPDETYWLADIIAAGEPEPWHRDGDAERWWVAGG